MKVEKYYLALTLIYGASLVSCTPALEVAEEEVLAKTVETFIEEEIKIIEPHNK